MLNFFRLYTKESGSLRIGVHSPGTVIELQVPAPLLIEGIDKLLISCHNILHQTLFTVINLEGSRTVHRENKLGKELCRSRNRLLGNGMFILKLLHKAEMLDEGMFLL